MQRVTPSAQRHPRPAAGMASIERLDGEDFIPLPDAEGAPAMTDAQVLTVALPVSDLEEIGLPATGLAGRQYVTADVLIGEDGIARAIRIVP
jgi:hypothetical protein